MKFTIKNRNCQILFGKMSQIKNANMFRIAAYGCVVYTTTLLKDGSVINSSIGAASVIEEGEYTCEQENIPAILKATEKLSAQGMTTIDIVLGKYTITDGERVYRGGAIKTFWEPGPLANPDLSQCVGAICTGAQYEHMRRSARVKNNSDTLKKPCMVLSCYEKNSVLAAMQPKCMTFTRRHIPDNSVNVFNDCLSTDVKLPSEWKDAEILAYKSDFHIHLRPKGESTVVSVMIVEGESRYANCVNVLTNDKSAYRDSTIFDVSMDRFRNLIDMVEVYVVKDQPLLIGFNPEDEEMYVATEEEWFEKTGRQLDYYGTRVSNLTELGFMDTWKGSLKDIKTAIGRIEEGTINVKINKEWIVFESEDGIESLILGG